MKYFVLTQNERFIFIGCSMHLLAQKRGEIIITWLVDDFV